MSIFETIWFANVLRFFIIVFGLWSLVYIGFGCYYFFRRFYHSQIREESEPPEKNWLRKHLQEILPHVVGIGLATILTLFYTLLETFSRVYQPMTWRAPFFLAINVSFFVALALMSKLQVKRLKRENV